MLSEAAPSGRRANPGTDGTGGGIKRKLVKTGEKKQRQLTHARKKTNKKN